jgi:tetratricopeptide (TPR) repeat protein
MGLAQISRFYNKMGEFYRKRREIATAKKYYQLSIELLNCDAMMNMAILYEDSGGNRETIEKYYLMSINCCPDRVVFFNFADYYRKIMDYENMIKYYKEAIEVGDDLESMYYLALHYQKMGNIPEMKKYLFLSLNHDILYYDENFNTKINPFLFYKALETTPECEEMTKNERDLHMSSLSTIYSEIAIYKNKINLFTRFNHVTECGICYEDKLNIDLQCAHCVCIDCYPRLYNTVCPFCRCQQGIPFMP